MNPALPSAFLARISTQLGDETATFVAALATPPIVSIRWNPQKIQINEREMPVLWHESGEYLAERPIFTQNPLFHAGAMYVQEASSMLVRAFLAAENYARVLDACAAPGGKSTLLSAALSSDTLLISNEVIRSRAAILAENLTRWGSANVVVTNNDVADFGKLPEFFDCILIDAPCSGEGMFRKDKDSIQEWSEENVRICAARQKRILADLLPTLAPEGHLIYSTCTYSPAENEEVIEWLLTNFPEMELAPVALPTHYGAKAITINAIDNAAYRCYPHLVKGEGFFITRLRKKGKKEEGEVWEVEELPAKKKSKQEKHSKKPAISVEKQVLPFCKEMVTAKDIEIFEENVFYFPEVLKANLPFLKGLHLLKKGVLLGKIQGAEFTPSHELAMSEVLAAHLPSHELDLATALSYLQKNDLPNDSSHTKGWLLATYQSVPLGWLKAAGNRLKNHFPINWRIRNL